MRVCVHLLELAHAVERKEPFGLAHAANSLHPQLQAVAAVNARRARTRGERAGLRARRTESEPRKTLTLAFEHRERPLEDVEERGT